MARASGPDMGAPELSINLIPLLSFALLLGISVFRPKRVLVSLVCGFCVVFPAIQFTHDMRSAVYVHELLIIAIGIAVILRKARSAQLRSLSPYGGHLLAIVTCSFLSTAVALFVSRGTDSQSINTLGEWAVRIPCLALAFIIPATLGGDLEEFYIVVKWFLGSLAIVLALAAIQYTSIYGVGNVFVADSGSASLDTGIGWLNRATIGTYSEFALFSCLLLFRVKRLSASTFVLAAVAFSGLLFASFSRSSVLSMLSFLGMMVIASKRDVIGSLLRLGATAAVLIAVGSQIPGATDRFVGAALDRPVLEEYAVEARSTGWHKAVTYMSRDIEILTVGAGFGGWSTNLREVTGLSSGHNVFLQVVGEMGVVGGFVYLSFFGLLAIRFYRTRGVIGPRGVVAGMMFGLVIALLVASLTTDILYPTSTMSYDANLSMFILGLGYSATCQCRLSRRNESDITVSAGHMGSGGHA